MPVYHNYLYDISTSLHPNAYRLRVVFNQLVSKQSFDSLKIDGLEKRMATTHKQP